MPALVHEARLLASLNHPNIAALHSLEESAGVRFLVLELVEGETLQERLAKGPIPMEETLHLALQISAGLEAAHETGIVHRDVKPSNLMVSEDGRIKILDFGVATALAPAIGDLQESLEISPETPTESVRIPADGQTMGTPPYMSPERVIGRGVDKRADIWAFGCVVYECLSGRRAFPGDSA